MNNISVVTIAKNEEKNINDFFYSVSWADEVILVDNGSDDKTFEVAKKFSKKVFQNHEKNLGLLKQFAISKASKKWILLLDIDEIPSAELVKQVKRVAKENKEFIGYSIPYANYLLNVRLKAKAFSFSKVRLFKKGFGSVLPFVVHEETFVKGNIDKLTGYLNHYSYRSISQTLRKFTHYAKEEAPIRYAKGERVDLKKFTLYPLHMFKSIFFEDEGWRDGIWGFGLALCFTYYEFMRYVYLWLYEQRKKSAEKTFI